MIKCWLSHAAPMPAMGSGRPTHAGPGHTAVSGNAKTVRVTVGTSLRQVGYRSARNPVWPPSSAHACFLRPRRLIQHAASKAYIYISRLYRILVPGQARAFRGWPRGGVRALFQTNATSPKKV